MGNFGGFSLSNGAVLTVGDATNFFWHSFFSVGPNYAVWRRSRAGYKCIWGPKRRGGFTSSKEEGQRNKWQRLTHHTQKVVTDVVVVVGLCDEGPAAIAVE